MESPPSFDDEVQVALADAEREATRRQHGSIEVEHFLLALLQQDGLVTQTLKRLQVDGEMLRARFAQTLGRLPAAEGTSPEPSTILTRDLEEAMLIAQVEQRAPDAAHVLMAISTATGGAAATLRSMGVTRENINNIVSGVRTAISRRNRVASSPPAPTPTPATTAQPAPPRSDETETAVAATTETLDAPPSWLVRPGTFPTLERYGIDLTRLAAKNALPPVVGRAMLRRRLLQTLRGCDRRAPLLVGEPGSGRDALVADLARELLWSPQAPLERAIVVYLDTTRLLANIDEAREGFELFESIAREVASRRLTCVLYLPDVHRLYERWGFSLPPIRAREQLIFIASTTPSAQSGELAEDAASWSPLILIPPTVNAAVAMLRAHRPRIEKHHRVVIHDSALRAIARVSSHLPSALPGAALELLDEAASAVRYQLEHGPDLVAVIDDALALDDRPASFDDDADLDEIRVELTTRWRAWRDTHAGTIEEREWGDAQRAALAALAATEETPTSPVLDRDRFLELFEQRFGHLSTFEHDRFEEIIEHTED